ncbi:DUF3710 domain-containing protein [Geodermatophilus sp. YIM 151500]|uniref:DUF3710 domain-containing protein n=1 Tax=Geodermatophilus sp. YIM 151500 TaxID=2984531 RepID=UPI0021E4E4A4|nr:DUF3710 domain-containing protein [Geodermatophilus sp. YIM 151500]MCV2488080.1 DUF3710 domain-containing protein [Geodermatophilus sp. YIM 151500]
MPFGRRRNRIDRSLRERGVPPEPQHREREVEETTGPWDEADAPDDGLVRVDLGALRLPAVPGGELRVDLNAQQQVVGATLRHGDSLLQVSVYAAPRAGGIWDDVRADLARNASGQGASLREVEGPFGTELAGTVVAVAPSRPDQQAAAPVRRPARFLGVDGPRWFLRGMITGSAAADPDSAVLLEDVFRNIVVVRGSAPMPVREQLPLTLPPQAAAQVAQQQQARRRAAVRPPAAPGAAPQTAVPPAAAPPSGGGGPGGGGGRGDGADAARDA